MSERDFNFRGSEDICNNCEPHWPRTRCCQKHTQLTEKHHLQNRFASNLGNEATGDEKMVNLNIVINLGLKSMMMPVPFSPIRYPISLMSSLDSLKVIISPNAKNHKKGPGYI